MCLLFLEWLHPLFLVGSFEAFVVAAGSVDVVVWMFEWGAEYVDGLLWCCGGVKRGWWVGVLVECWSWLWVCLVDVVACWW